MSDQFGMGWVKDDKAVEDVKDFYRATYGRVAEFQRVYKAIAATDDNSDVVLWQAEKIVRGEILPSWNQGQVGSCVGFGTTRAIQDLLYNEIATGQSEQYPGSDLCPEITYAGSRVEVGKGQLRGSDGSVGAWAADFVNRWGVVRRDKYQSVDLSRYNEATTRRLGDAGVPDEIEAIAKLRPVSDIAQIKNTDELWVAIGAHKSVAVCSNQGFTTVLERGMCRPSGEWGHCMCIRGRFTMPNGKRGFVIQNSWGGYLSGNRMLATKNSGEIELPEGCFGATEDVLANMVSQGDTWAFAGLAGWKSDKLSWIP